MVNVLDFLLQVFGVVEEGLDTLTRINEAFTDENYKPYKNIRYGLSYELLLLWLCRFSIFHVMYG